MQRRKIIDLIANRDESECELMERKQRPLMKLAMNMLLTVRRMQENVLMIRFMKYGNHLKRELEY